MQIAVEEWELYNNGILLCKWFDTEIDSIESIEKYVAKIKAEYNLNSNDLEMFIGDVEGEHLGLIHGDESVTYAYEVAETISEVESYKYKAIEFLLAEGLANDLDDAIAKADDVIIHEKKTMEDIAYDLIQECYNIHELSPLIANHLDYQGIARDLEYEGCYFEIGLDVFEYIG